MPWPDIFFKARKPATESELPPPFTPVPETPKPVPVAVQPPTIKPLPVALGPKAVPPPVAAKVTPVTTSTRTLPAMHGVVLRPPVRNATSTMKISSPSITPATPIKNIEQLMAEADPVRTLSETGSVRMLKRLAPEPGSPTETPAEPAPIAANPPPVAPAMPPPPPPPPLQPAAVSSPAETAKLHPAPAPTPSTPSSDADNTPFLLKPAVSTTRIPRINVPPPPPLMPYGSIFHRRAKMTEVARIVLPPKREETAPLPPPPESSPTVVPPAFPVAAMTARANQPSPEVPAPVEASPPAKLESAMPKQNATQDRLPETSPTQPSVAEPPPLPPTESAPSATSESAPEIAARHTPTEASPQGELPGLVSPLEKPPAVAETSPAPASLTPAPEKPAEPLPDLPVEPKVDPQAHQPEPTATPLPKPDPEAHQPPPTPAAPLPRTELSTTSAAPEKREFHLANGERVAGTVLSETPEAVYIEHSTLGVLTIPRAQIAKRLVEIILINGDRIVGDIMAETADMLYVRHASLGMLSVPRAQRSTRVVEAILKDGDRILGEVLTETDTFTVIRSATMGTVTVPHNKISMLNRKIEQIELKALPPPAPELKDKAPG